MRDKQILEHLQTMKACVDKIVRLLEVQVEQPSLPSFRSGEALTDEDPMPFGKHRGKKIKDLPVDYMDWLLAQDEIKGHPGLEAWRKNKKKAAKDLVEIQIEELTPTDDVPF